MNRGSALNVCRKCLMILLLFFVLSVFSAFGIDSIRSYKAVYTADSNPEFVEVDSASLNLESGSGNWAARIGVLRVFVDRKSVV